MLRSGKRASGSTFDMSSQSIAPQTDSVVNFVDTTAGNYSASLQNTASVRSGLPLWSQKDPELPEP